jgi:hypothetical protein
VGGWVGEAGQGAWGEAGGRVAGKRVAGERGAGGGGRGAGGGGRVVWAGSRCASAVEMRRAGRVAEVETCCEASGWLRLANMRSCMPSYERPSKLPSRLSGEVSGEVSIGGVRPAGCRAPNDNGAGTARWGSPTGAVWFDWRCAWGLAEVRARVGLRWPWAHSCGHRRREAPPGDSSEERRRSDRPAYVPKVTG